jgi:nucleoside-diphosphate-sugar epimerase
MQVAWEAKRALPLWTDGSNSLPTCHVEDLARTVMAVAHQRPAGQYHVVADAAPVTLKEATDSIARVFAQQARGSCAKLARLVRQAAYCVAHADTHAIRLREVLPGCGLSERSSKFGIA